MKSTLLAPALLTGAILIGSAALAQSTTSETRPRVHEVDARLKAQNARIDQALAKGTITAAQATALHAKDASIKSEETTDESFDGGHLTKADLKALNQQLNDISKQIGDPAHSRVHEVNARLRTQDARINRDEAADKITAAQATAFHADDAAIKSEEVTERGLDDGRLTRADEKSLNEQISSVGHQVGTAAGTTGSHSSSHGSSHK